MKNRLIGFLLAIGCYSLVSHYATGKVLIMTYVHSRPDFIETHAQTFKAFLQDEYEYVVFNDAPNDDMCRQMEHTCRKLGVRCIRVPQHLHNGRQTPNYRHCDENIH